VSAWELALGAVGSLVAGFLGSAIGLVLGTLRLPLVLLLAGDANVAAGTNIGISAASAAAGSVGHARAGRISWHVAAWMLPPSIAGALVGGYFGHAVPRAALLGVAAAILAYSGVDLVVRPFRAQPRARARIAPALAGGFAIGLLGGAVGVILGTLRMPVLLRGVGLTAAQAVGTNLVVGFALGSVALAAHAVRDEVEWTLLAASVPAALVGGYLGARVTGRLSERFLRRAIGIALVVIAIALGLEAGLG
jgi:hypothetical protein